MANQVILLVEENKNDIQRVKRALPDSTKLMVVRDALDALSYLQGSGPYRNRNRFPFPDVVLLDPKRPRFRRIPSPQMDVGPPRSRAASRGLPGLPRLSKR